ncbi:helix-turn-helix transcriptional regulator [Leucobacter komagatae]|uniref:AraC family transcriptional regulator n=1 Tax=Leucobacter komagatae TaxID=55969 RepID=A0A0D0IWE2_9MICO|nr:AraC family transcriptional regulator [Leucobacter komagatae]KIP53863.1 AraC family transcriptional regulator [Leucobacter komagatae]
MTEFWRNAAMPQLEARRSCQENSCYRSHTHDTFSLGVIEAGTSRFRATPHGPVQLQPGDTIAIPAGHAHACNPDDGRWQYEMIHIDESWAATLTPERRGDELFNAITVWRQPELRATVTGWTELLFTGAPPERIEHGLRGVLAALRRAPIHQRFTRERDPELLDRLAPAIDRLQRDTANPLLDDLAWQIGMTKYQLVRAMGTATGLTPLAWRQNARIVRARHLLRAGTPIAETAHELGFTDQSHFHRVFRAHVAASPGAYRG